MTVSDWLFVIGGIMTLSIPFFSWMVAAIFTHTKEIAILKNNNEEITTISKKLDSLKDALHAHALDDANSNGVLVDLKRNYESRSLDILNTQKKILNRLSE